NEKHQRRLHNCEASHSDLAVTDCADSFLLSEGIPDTELNYACGNIDDPSTSKTCTRCGRRTERRVRCRRVSACPPDCVVIREVCRVKNIEAFRDDLYFPILADEIGRASCRERVWS